MAEYIEKQAATMIPVLPKEHREYQTMNLDDAYENGWYDALECVEKLPPADVRPAGRGRWVYHPEATWQYECDNCGCYVPGVWTYCPECGNLNGPNTITELNLGCGADMRGGDADGEEKD